MVIVKTWLLVQTKRLRLRRYCLHVSVLLCTLATATTAAEDYVVHSFERQQLTDVYYSEGVNVGDINNDGKQDVVHGPYWFEGPKFEKKFEIYPAQAQPRQRYADSFFSWVYDFDGDGRRDVLAVGFPGTPAYVYQSPGPSGWDQPWEKYPIIDSVANESPHFVDLVGDEQPELVCTNDGRFGYATINQSDPLSTWTFHAVSESIAPKR